MKNIIIAIICIVSLNISLFAQNNIDSVLSEIERNNTTLSALKEKAEANKLGNKTGIYMQNPEVEFNYLWGNDVVGNRQRSKHDLPSVWPTRRQREVCGIENLDLCAQLGQQEGHAHITTHKMGLKRLDQPTRTLHRRFEMPFPHRTPTPGILYDRLLVLHQVIF